MGLFKKNKYKQVSNIPIPQEMQQHMPNTMARYPQMQNTQQRESMITSIEIDDNGKYIYKVITNYPLNIGFCNLTQ